MTGEDFTTRCWRCLEVRQHIVDQARRHSKYDNAAQEDHIQEAWLAISTAPHCIGVEGCKYLAERVIYSSYWQEHKARLLQNNPGLVGNIDNTDGWAGDDSACVRVSEVLRRMSPAELSSAIASELVEFLVPVLERMGWRHS
jgi:hypothetical protein